MVVAIEVGRVRVWTGAKRISWPVAFPGQASSLSVIDLTPPLDLTPYFFRCSQLFISLLEAASELELVRDMKGVGVWGKLDYFT